MSLEKIFSSMVISLDVVSTANSHHFHENPSGVILHICDLHFGIYERYTYCLRLPRSPTHNSSWSENLKQYNYEIRSLEFYRCPLLWLHGTGIMAPTRTKFSKPELRKSTSSRIKKNSFDRRLCRTASKGSMLRPISDKYGSRWDQLELFSYSKNNESTSKFEINLGITLVKSSYHVSFMASYVQREKVIRMFYRTLVIIVPVNW